MKETVYDKGADLLGEIERLRARRDALDRALDAAMLDLETRNEAVGAMLRGYRLKSEMARTAGREERHEFRC